MTGQTQYRRMSGARLVSEPLQADLVPRLLFRYLAIPWLQLELDRYRQRVNNFMPRKNKHKLTPHGRRQDIHFRPQEFGTKDFKVSAIPMSTLPPCSHRCAIPQITVPPAAVAQARATFTDAGHPVFELVPASFALIADTIYDALGRPVVDEKSLWVVYSSMLDQIETGIESDTIPHGMVRDWAEGVLKEVRDDDKREAEAEEARGVPDLFADLGRPLEGFVVVNNGEPGPLMAAFSDDEDSDGENWIAR